MPGRIDVIRNTKCAETASESSDQHCEFLIQITRIPMLFEQAFKLLYEDRLPFTYRSRFFLFLQSSKHPASNPDGLATLCLQTSRKKQRLGSVETPFPFTFEDLQRCLYKQANIRLLKNEDAKKPLPSESQKGEQCFCEYTSETTRFVWQFQTCDVRRHATLLHVLSVCLYVHLSVLLWTSISS